MDSYDWRLYYLRRLQEHDDGPPSLASQNLHGSKLTMLMSEDEEFKTVSQLVQGTWKQGLYRRDGDARGLDHIGVKVTKIERVENSKLYERYSQEKWAMLARSWTIRTMPASSSQIMTSKCLNSTSPLGRKLSPSVNEHFLFHGTKEHSVMSIADYGFSRDHCRDRSLLGPALYFAESATKADMYADYRENRTEGPKQIILARVLLGDAYVHRSKLRQVFISPPCKRCLQATSCYCSKQEHYDSIIGDSSRPFKIFALYNARRCYPEYVITYKRIRLWDVLNMDRKIVRAGAEDDRELSRLFARAALY